MIRVLSEWMLREESLALTKNALAEPTLYSLDEENRRRFPASPAYDVLITLVNPDPEKLKIEWDLQAMTDGMYCAELVSWPTRLANLSTPRKSLEKLTIGITKHAIRKKYYKRYTIELISCPMRLANLPAP